MFLAHTWLLHHFFRKTVRTNGFFEKCYRSLCLSITGFAEIKINDVAFLIDSTIVESPLAFDLDIGFIHTP